MTDKIINIISNDLTYIFQDISYQYAIP